MDPHNLRNMEGHCRHQKDMERGMRKIRVEATDKENEHHKEAWDRRQRMYQNEIVAAVTTYTVCKLTAMSTIYSCNSRMPASQHNGRLLSVLFSHVCGLSDSTRMLMVTELVCFHIKPKSFLSQLKAF